MQLTTLTTTNKHKDPISRVMAFNTGRIQEVLSNTKFSYKEKRNIVQWVVTSAPSAQDYNKGQQISVFINKWGNYIVNDNRIINVDGIVYAMANPRNLSQTIVFYDDSNRIELTQLFVPISLTNFILLINANNSDVKAKSVTAYLVNGDNDITHSLGVKLIGLQMMLSDQAVQVDWANKTNDIVTVTLSGGGGINVTLNLYYI